jgi:uncharacterized membrane protein YphA (DoxX/SURF4 family)
MPEQVNKAAAIAFVRVFIGAFWLFEVTIGHNWKLGGFGSGGHPGWTGPGAGDEIRENIAASIENGTWLWAAWIFQNVIEPNALVFNYMVIVLQVALGLFFIFGFMVRPMALMAVAFDLSIYFLGNSRIPPFFTAAHLFVLSTNAGMYFGVDGVLATKVRHARGTFGRAVSWLLDLPFLARRRVQDWIIAGSAILAAFFFMNMVMRATPTFNLVAMELAFIFGAVAIGLALARRSTDQLAIVVALMRIFIGYKFLHEIWVRVQPGVNGLPGWAPKQDQLALFENIATSHWAPFSWIITTAIVPLMTFWVLLFAVVQFSVGAALLVGYRTRLAATIGLAYVGGLGILGFTRLAPFVFGLLVVVLALDGGRALGFDSDGASSRKPVYGLPIAKGAVPILVLVTTVNAIAAAIAVVMAGGVIPDSYKDGVGAMTTAMVAIFSGLFALVGWLQMESGGPEPITHDGVPAHQSEILKDLGRA